MWGERLKRILIIGGATGLVVLGLQVLLRWQAERRGGEQLISSLTQITARKAEDLKEKILGKAAEVLPDTPLLEESDEKAVQGEEKGRKDQIEKKITQSGEPLTQPVEDIRHQAEILMEMIKRLPQDQIEALKRQLFKEFCEKLEEEER